MTRGVNRTYAKIMGKAKEALDDQVADWADRISDCRFLMIDAYAPVGWGISDWVCSAGQTTDDEDNKHGRDCGDPQHLDVSCSKCCIDRKGIEKNTPEGTEDRPFGPRCHGRYKTMIEWRLGREVVVEDAEVKK
jgi:hypothetical protein